MSSAIDAMDALKQQLSECASEFEVDSQSDTEEGILYLTLDTDATDKAYLGKQNSAVCLDGQFITEFDLRIGTHDIDTVEQAVLGTRYARYAEYIDTGHGPKEIPHIRAYNTRIHLDEFTQFVSAITTRLNSRF